MEGHPEVHAGDGEEQGHADGGPGPGALGGAAGHDAPVEREAPEPVAEVERRREHADQIEHGQGGRLHLVLHQLEHVAGVDPEPRAEAGREHVVGDEGDQEHAGEALPGEHVVAGVRQARRVELRLEDDDQSEDRVEQDRDGDAEQLDQVEVGEGLEEFDLLVVGRRALQRERVGEKVLAQEHADRDDSGEAVEPAEREVLPRGQGHLVRLLAAMSRAMILEGDERAGRSGGECPAARVASVLERLIYQRKPA